MGASRGSLVGRAATEFLVVMVGILAALAVDDWRQARSDRALEVHLLTSLLADLEDDRGDAELQVRLVEGHRNAVNHLLALSGHPLAAKGEVYPDTPEAINQSLGTLWNIAELQVFDPTYTEMLSTGSIRLIGDPVLRREIAKYYQAAEQWLSVPLRQVDPRPDLIRALAEVGIVAGAAAEMPDLVPRLRSNPTIATHALRIRRYYQSNEGTLSRMQELRESLDQAVEGRLRALR
ncbi:MAG: hypothetical protein OEO79_18355 [Gemmatimonadota bacterium]|nr:hypothetical protein [Gemmatimonadota bacterium]